MNNEYFSMVFLIREKRLPHNANTQGKLSGDHAGHLAADGSGVLQI
ncbi:hypothetical protein ACFFIX_10065 [Metabacillus herbersteinensis]|uniref:Uncharacterized protein n=1 Tax=Metabacillus herbersteinensis TaxID=283816 RepID=A0ABV6GE04_9BACI